MRKSHVDDMLFDDWAELHERDPEEFEACRDQAIALFIARSTPKQAEICRKLQREIDWVIRSANDGHEIQLKLQSMLLDQLEFMIEAVQCMNIDVINFQEAFIRQK